jgi:hypothetical protein
MVIAYFLAALYVVGVVVSYFMVYTTICKNNKDGDPEALDFLTAFGAGVFWPIFVPIYVAFFIMK